MTVIEIAKTGDPDVLSPVQRPLPQPGCDEVLIKVSAAGVNRPDVMQRKGLYPPPPGASDIPGLEIAGAIVSLGSDVKNLFVGDEVCVLVTGGGYAEYCLAPAALCLPIPRGLSHIQAAALPEAFYTVWTNVFERGALVRGERFLVHGGSSGIGTTAIQMAAAFGATVFTTAGSDEKCEFCRHLGAGVAINYTEQDFVEVVQSETGNAGVNLILDIVGGDYLNRNLSCLAADGRLVQIALLKGPKTVINLLPIMLKKLTLTGSTLRPRSVAEKARLAESLHTQVWPLLEAGTVRPIIHTTFPLKEAAKAHELMESSAHIGKIVLTV
ncbi:MAG: NAD(P)H-quinone oxidoreductase [Methylococcaceae bacterium]|nr:NAD(P)H-quinone oxidoreductase [Methylococcaceae bacterium]MCI0733126.1 NAD(P)H-quinone oxidoreductase [Methylococcaceae bacterium]